MAAQTDDTRSKDESLRSCFEEINYMINNITLARLSEQTGSLPAAGVFPATGH